MLSIGTLVAYTLVAISVLVTRYTPGVQSVKLEKDGSKEATNRWLKTICCRPGEMEGSNDVLPEVGYQQVQTNDKESSDRKSQPDAETSFRVRICVIVLTLAITALTICLTRAISHLGQGDAWAILLCCIFGLMIVACLMFIMRQPTNSATFPFMVPGIPIIPAITIFFNVLLIVMLNHWTYIRFGVWMTLGKSLQSLKYKFISYLSLMHLYHYQSPLNICYHFPQLFSDLPFSVFVSVNHAHARSVLYIIIQLTCCDNVQK